MDRRFQDALAAAPAPALDWLVRDARVVEQRFAPLPKAMQDAKNDSDLKRLAKAGVKSRRRPLAEVQRAR